MRSIVSAVCLATALAGCAQMSGTSQLGVLSAGAVEPGLRDALALYEKETGTKVAVTFNTAPQIRERVLDRNEKFDVVVVPPNVMDAFAKAQRVDAGRSTLGSVGQGIAVRPGAPVPDVSSLDALKRAVLQADSVVFNRATGGQYIEGMLKKIGVYGDIEKKTTRYASAFQVMDHLLKGSGREVGFAPITEIKIYEKKSGLRFVGPLPPEVQQRNTYVASAMSGGANAAAAAALVRFLGTPPARAALAGGGVE
jgi:molybdate transport system substrate-binding protein